MFQPDEEGCDVQDDLWMAWYTDDRQADACLMQVMRV